MFRRFRILPINLVSFCLFIATSCILSVAQQTSATSPAEKPVENGKLIRVVLTSAIDVNKARAGDILEFLVSINDPHGQYTTNPDPICFGKVTLAAGHHNDQPSSLGLILDGCQYKDGRKVLFHAYIEKVVYQLSNSNPGPRSSVPFPPPQQPQETTCTYLPTGGSVCTPSPPPFISPTTSARSSQNQSNVRDRDNIIPSVEMNVLPSSDPEIRSELVQTRKTSNSRKERS